MPLRRSFFYIILLLSFSSLCTANSASVIEKQIRDYLDHYSQSIETANNVRTKYSIGNIDPRLNLKDCKIPLTYEFSTPPERGQRTTLKISCEGNIRWTIYNQVNFEIFKDIWVLNKNLHRGQIISSDDLQKAEYNISRLRGGFIEADIPIYGMKLKRNIYAESPIYFNQLAKVNAIKKGDEVVINANTPFMTISTKGIAMKNGNIGDQIPIKNTQSKRIVKATVLAKGKVEITL